MAQNPAVQQRRDFLRQHGPHIEAMFANDGLTAALVAISRVEITNLREASVNYTLRNEPQAAVIAAAKSEGIYEFFATLERLAKEYGKSKTSTPE